MLVVRDEVASTMELAHQLAEGGALAGQAVLARRQRAARGRQGRAWSAEPGGLWLSVVCRPDASCGIDALGLRVGLGLAIALEHLAPELPRIDLKWPNDLLLGGLKLAGILAEARWQGDHCAWVVVGVGVNVCNALPAELSDSATRLADWLETPPDPEAIAPAIASAVERAARGGGLDEQELAAWTIRDALRGQRISRPLAGTALGVTPDGALVVRATDGSRHECRAGVVALPD
jgi:BirA family biotin operon repressor/biotin-[acetyl-CoA-carboxylase] ligase